MIQILFSFLLFVVPLAADEDPIQQKIRAHMEEFKIPGMAAVIVKDGKAEIYSFGWADRERRIAVTPRTIFNLASVTKVFVTTAIACEVLDGRMKLDQSAATFIPGLEQGPLESFGQVRLQDLATHTASLPRDPPIRMEHGKYPRSEIIRYLRDWQAPYPIGSKYVYSNMSFGILGMALQGLEREPMDTVFRRLIFAPLAMSETELVVSRELSDERAIGYLKSGERSPHFQPIFWPGGGSLNSSASDMAKFLLANMGLQGPPRLLQAMQLAHKSLFKVNDHLSLGLAWQNFENKGLHVLDKDGGVAAYSSYIGFTVDNKFGIVLLCNKGKAKIPPLGRQLLFDLSVRE